MKIIQIPKKTPGKFRTIYACETPEERNNYRSYLPVLINACQKNLPKNVAHGFMPERSPVTNAIAHIGYSYTLCMDLSDFFDSVTAKHLYGLIPVDVINNIIVDGAARQGLPTSPAAANLAAAKMDKAILKRLEKLNLNVVYTRYADDLAFSFDDFSIVEIIKKEVAQCARRCGFKINVQKTRVMAAKAGCRRVCGISVGDQNIHPTRAVKRKLRAAIHQKNTNQINGLKGWAALKLPKVKEAAPAPIISQKEKDDAKILIDFWKIKTPKNVIIPEKETEIIDGETLITGDPIYTLGMSNFTNGWVSCMRHPDRKYRQGVVFWLQLKGTRIAALLSDREMNVSGVVRRQMKARTLVHTLRNGVKVFDRIYGNSSDIATLSEKLLKYGIISMVDAKKLHKGERVVGHVPHVSKPYFDSLNAIKMKASSGPYKGKNVWVAKI